MLKVIWDLVFGTTKVEGYSWIDLDNEMRRKLKTAAVVSVLILFFIILASLYFYLKLPPLSNLVAKISGNISESVQKKGEIPSWIIWTGTFFFSVLLIITILFAWALVDFGKMHRKIDRLTFHLTPAVGKHIVGQIRKCLRCPDSDQCALKLRAKERGGMRVIMTNVFYHFANADMVGEFNQKEKRRQVFSVWTHYYLSNFVFIILTLITLWFVFLTFIRTRWWVSLIVFMLALLIIISWIRKGRKYKQSVEELAEDQIGAWCRFEQSKLTAQAKSIITVCKEDRCPLY